MGSHPLVSRLLKGMFNARPPAPRYSGSWDVSVVVEFLRNHRSADLTIPELDKKVGTLMALANADRCSDLTALDRDYLKWTPSGVQFTVVCNRVILCLNKHLKISFVEKNQLKCIDNTIITNNTKRSKIPNSLTCREF